MNFLPYAKSAMAATFAFKLPAHIPTLSALHNPKFRIKNPRVSTRKHAKACPANAGRVPQLQGASRERGSLTPSSLNPLTPRYCVAAFTLIELMAATTVLSIILLMMVGMQDQMSKAWSNSNRRTDATREARAACRLMAEDLSCLVFRPLAFDNQDSYAAGLENQGIPFLYSSNGIGPITITGNQPSAAYFFGISARKPAGTNPVGLAIVGYYIASSSRINVNGFTNTSYNLHRYYAPASDTLSSLSAWFTAPSSTRTADLLFKPDPTKDDILARNTCNLKITIYNRQNGNTKGLGNKVTNGLNYQCVSAGNDYYAGSKIQAEITVYPEDFAQKIPYTSWLDSANIQKFARSYEFRVDIPRD